MGIFSGFKAQKPLVVIAPDKFKGTLRATEVASEIAAACTRATVRVCPMCDGGDGTAQILGALFALPACTMPVPDALGEEHDVTYYNDGHQAVVDSASVIGLASLAGRELRPFQSTSYGLGMLVRHLLDSGTEHIYVGIGGTATVDCGAGFLQALGVRFADVEGAVLETPVRAADLDRIYAIDLSGVNGRDIRRRITVLSDVAVPLEDSLMFAAQKGVTPAETERLRAALANFRAAVDETLLPSDSVDMHGGAGGGLGYAFERVLRCDVADGARFMIDRYGIFDGTAPALVITGEGAVDAQTGTGKVVGALYSEARKRNIPVVAVVGRDRLDGTRPGLAVLSTEQWLGSMPLTHDTALAALRGALRDGLRAICSRMSVSV